MNYQDFLQYLQKMIAGLNHQEKRLKINEEVQKLVLYGINQSQISDLYFLGGTNLRLCYDLDRYSEDLDFSYYGEKLDLDTLSQAIVTPFKNLGIAVSLHWNTNTNVYKSFLKIPNIFFDVGVAQMKDECVCVKIEIDINPPTHQQTNLLILKCFLGNYVLSNYDIATTFSGKIGAVLLRKYAKGRDYYDLLWYFTSVSKAFNLDFLVATLEQSNQLNSQNRSLPKTHKEACNMLLEHIQGVDLHAMKDDLKRFTNFGEEVAGVYLDSYKDTLLFQMKKYLRGIEDDENKYTIF